MEKKAYFQAGLKASNSLGFNRPAVSIVDAAVVEVRTGGKQKNYAIFMIDGHSCVLKWVAPVEDLMGLDSSPVKFDNNTPFIEYQGLLVSIPSDRNQPVSFRYSL